MLARKEVSLWRGYPVERLISAEVPMSILSSLDDTPKEVTPEEAIPRRDDLRKVTLPTS